MKLLKDKILVRIESTDNKTKSGIILSTKKLKKNIGEVLDVGPDSLKYGIKVGDRVQKFQHATGTPGFNDGELFLKASEDIELILNR